MQRLQEAAAAREQQKGEAKKKRRRGKKKQQEDESSDCEGGREKVQEEDAKALAQAKGKTRMSDECIGNDMEHQQRKQGYASNGKPGMRGPVQPADREKQAQADEL